MEKEVATELKKLFHSVNRIEDGLFGDKTFGEEGLIAKVHRHELELKNIKERHLKTTAIVGAAGAVGGWGLKAIGTKMAAWFAHL